MKNYRITQYSLKTVPSYSIIQFFIIFWGSLKREKNYISDSPKKLFCTKSYINGECIEITTWGIKWRKKRNNRMKPKNIHKIKSKGNTYQKKYNRIMRRFLLPTKIFIRLVLRLLLHGQGSEAAAQFDKCCNGRVCKY